MKQMTPQDAYWRARDYGWSQELGDIVINRGDPRWAYIFARDIEGADIDRLQQVVIDAGNLGYVYLFARDVEGSNINRLQQVVIDSESQEWAYRFAVDVKGSNIDRLQQVVIDAGEPYCALDFARFVPGANISDLVDFVLVKEPEKIGQLFDERPDLKRKYKMGELRRYIRKLILEVKSDIVSSGLTIYDDGSLTGVKGMALDIVDVDSKYVHIVDPDKRKIRMSRDDFDKRKFKVTV